MLLLPKIHRSLCPQVSASAPVWVQDPLPTRALGWEGKREGKKEGFGQMLQQGWGWKWCLEPVGGIGEERPAALCGVLGSFLGKGDSI